jgi:dATP pyrophosphohydrolase
MRAPFQVLAIPYIKEEGEYKYAIFKRADFKIWQALSGGGEENETPIEAMRREIYEEAMIDDKAPFIRLASATTIPAAYAGGLKWGNEIIMVPEIAFGVEVSSKDFTISHEHTEYEWLSCKEATEKLKYDSNKSALWELDYRLKNGIDGIEKNIQLVEKIYSSK